MSRRRFGDADDTYKDFISAIDDQQHKRKRAAQKEAALAAQTAAQQQAAQAQSAQSGPPPFELSTGGAGGYQSGPYEPVVGLGYRGSEAEDDYASALPVNAMDRDSWPGLPPRRQSSIALGFGSGTRSPATGNDEDAPLMHEERRRGGLQAPPSDHAWISKRNLDLVVQRKSMWILANGMFGIALMIAILQTCWDPLWQTRRYGVDMTAPADYYSDIDFVSSRLVLEPAPLPRQWSWAAVAAECPSPARSYVTEALKLVLTLSTLVLCWQILDRKRMQVNLKFREQRRKLKANGYNQERDQLYMSSLSSNVSTLGLLSLSAASFRWELWLSLFVCLIQPLPFTQQLTHGVVSDKIGLLMWLRLHLLFRVIRDCSEIWLARRSIKHQSAFQTKVPDFDWWLACKTICYRDPLFFAGCFYVVSILLFAHALYIAERDLLPKFFDFWSSLFVSLQIVSVGWPADVWEIYMPISVLGKLVSLLAGMAGLLLISFVIATVGQTLQPTKFEENALNFIAMEKVRQRERDGSARLIQYVWKNAQREAELEAKLAPKNPALYEQLSEQEEKNFMETFLAKSKELRIIRRERAELEERYDPTSERNISPMDLYMDTKLEAIRTDIHHQNAKHQQQFLTTLATLNQLLHKMNMKEKQKQMQQQQQTQQQQSSQGAGLGSGTKKQQRAARGAAAQQQQQQQNTAASSGQAAAVPAASASPPLQERLQEEVQQHLLAVEQEQRRADEDDDQFQRLARSLEHKILDSESMQPPRQPGPPNPIVLPHIEEQQQMPLLSQPSPVLPRNNAGDDEGQPGPGASR